MRKIRVILHEPQCHRWVHRYVHRHALKSVRIYFIDLASEGQQKLHSSQHLTTPYQPIKSTNVDQLSFFKTN